ncbi:MAG TPA: DUF350 domain-containing protein [Candidatus Limnocylindrales bacterium]|nr:DUF350 domain-containing protein [Candidatus Limnocylindrales bacterium]
MGAFIASVFSALLGILLFILAYKVYDLIVPFDLTKELEEDQNIAVGIVIAGMIIGISIIIAATIMPAPQIVMPK